MQNQVSIKPGYKDIPHIGYIPEDWEILSLGKIGNTYGGLTGKDKEDFGKGSPYIPYMNIFTNSIIKDNYFDLVNVKEGEKQHNVVYGDLLFTTSSETPQEVGMCSTYLGNITELYLNSFCFGFNIEDKNKYSSLYLSSYFRSYLGRKIMYRLAQGATRYNLGKANLLKTHFGLPPFKEQKKIAEILKTSDTQIDITKNIIQKIELRNKGLQQQLLTGKKRLDGFSEKWNELHLKDVFNRVVRKNEELHTNVITISAQRGLINQEKYFKKQIASKLLGGYYLINRGEFAYNKSYSKGYPMGAIKRLNNYDKGVVTTLYICFQIKEELNYNSDYFENYFQAGLLVKGLQKVAQEGARAHGLLNITATDFFNLKIKIPNGGEQKAIANVLNKATEQLDYYKSKLSKLELEKKGLMQQLLTGKVRVKI